VKIDGECLNIFVEKETMHYVWYGGKTIKHALDSTSSSFSSLDIQRGGGVNTTMAEN